MAQSSSWFDSSVVPFRLTFLMWLVFSIEVYFNIPLSNFGIVPLEPLGLIGIFTGPVLHGSFQHLLSNTLPLLFLGSVLYFFYSKIAGTVFFRSYFWTNIMVWLFGRHHTSHIGASGLVYGLAFFSDFFWDFSKGFHFPGNINYCSAAIWWSYLWRVADRPKSLLGIAFCRSAGGNLYSSWI